MSEQKKKKKGGKKEEKEVEVVNPKQPLTYKYNVDKVCGNGSFSVVYHVSFQHFVLTFLQATILPTGNPQVDKEVAGTDVAIKKVF